MKVTVYSTPTCPYCVMAKDFFKENNVEFIDLNVAEDMSAGQEMVKKSGQMGVPVIIIENDGQEEVIVGFDQNKIMQVLGK